MGCVSKRGGREREEKQKEKRGGGGRVASLGFHSRWDFRRGEKTEKISIIIESGVCFNILK
jgi:hypothetical protein